MVFSDFEGIFEMKRRTFLKRSAQIVATPVAAALFVAPAVVRAAPLDVVQGYSEIASKFQWEVRDILLSNAAAPPGASHLILCYGKFQDGKDYQCAAYVNFEGEYVAGVFESTDPEAILTELATTFDQAMRRRFDWINDPGKFNT